MNYFDKERANRGVCDVVDSLTSELMKVDLLYPLQLTCRGRKHVGDTIQCSCRNDSYSTKSTKLKGDEMTCSRISTSDCNKAQDVSNYMQIVIYLANGRATSNLILSSISIPVCCS